MWYNLSCHSQAESAFLFLSNSRLSVRVPLDCDKHEKQQVGGSLIRGTMKRCSCCKELKQETEFPRNRTKKDGLNTYCKVCAVIQKTQWRKDNPEKSREFERNRHQRQNNPEQMRAIDRRYYLSHTEEVKQKDLMRRSRLAGTSGKFTVQEWEQLKEFYNYTCLCCGRREPEIKLTHDHVKPVVMGGENSIRNIQPLCGHCNSSKGAKHIDYRNRFIWEEVCL